MSKFDALINQRLKNREEPSKMAALAKQSASGHLSSFSGIFGVGELNQSEKDTLEEILTHYATTQADVTVDLRSLISITCEVKAINNQAAILHGERIKRAQQIFKKYEEGAFTAWLLATYGNRQTPYNFLQYYEFFEAMPKTLRPQIEAMPRQAVYTLASRQGPLELKQSLVEKYNGQTKQQLIDMIRELFPLALQDKRRQNFGNNAIQGLKRLCKLLGRRQLVLTKDQKATLEELMELLEKKIKGSKVK